VQVARESCRSLPTNGPRSALSVRPDVADAIAAGRPVVALESTLITHGLPRPRNLEVARAAEAAVRAAGAVPATIALRDACIVIGLSEEELSELADAPAGKASRQNLAAALVQGGWWGTTVSATMVAAHAAGIRVFATGGIGGVHRGAERSFDVSADLEELARTPVAVVSAGPKAVVAARATLEYLETRGVPVIGLGTTQLPGFWSRESGVPVPVTARDEREAAAIVTQHWSLGLGSGVLVTVPIPEANALPHAESEAAIAQALDEAETAGTSGPDTTPWLLARVAELTEGRSLAANAALIVHNAAVAARLAIALAALEPAAPRSTGRDDR
jgi:pseudouridine-5'-phosphate glycosidase